ncbi:MAG: FAD-dependent monooxygenase, partial [Paludibacteraceae bacterium]|nr:FAD-dependent monooxygenase [Paludibacteraceae bacterium]
MEQKQITVTPAKAKSIEEQYRIVKRSVDARQRDIKVLLTVLCDDEGHYLPIDSPIPLYTPPVYQDVHQAAKQVHIIGAGPAGLFAALTLLEHGIKPIIYERGKEVSERKKDIALLNRNEGLNPESNYCFGEGGAGTFSDGKLFSRSKKKGNMQRVMEIFHYFGAPDTVLYETHAHIGSDKLPSIIRRMRECILDHGGEVHFETQVDEPLFKQLLASGEPIILAIGHSAHDTYRMLQSLGVTMEDKGFAMGVRVEHPQALINQLMYHLPINSKLTKLDGNSTLYTLNSKLIEDLGNASYSLVTQVEGRGVYSFCMCPGGHIVPAGSTDDGCVVNGMSASHRNSPYANSGIVVELRPEDVLKFR